MPGRLRRTKEVLGSWSQRIQPIKVRRMEWSRTLATMLARKQRAPVLSGFLAPSLLVQVLWEGIINSPRSLLTNLDGF